LVFLLLAAGLLLALPGQVGAQVQDPPGRVARLNFIQGSVSMQPAGTQDWFDANPNRPLTTGDNLWSGDDGRGEFHLGSASMRLSNDTGISFLNLNDQAVQIQLAQGTLDVRLRQLGDNDAYEVDTPNLAFSLLRPGEYRISVDPNGNTTAITVWSGSGEVTGGGSAYNLDPGQQGIFSGTSPLSYDNEYAPPYDDFDNWCLSRDRREDQSQSARYISREVIGYDDLDAYGTWRTDPEYGNVWVPSGVAVGWAPYHLGHWAYVAPWGWTWVDDQPWGFAPFHYGRWAYAGGGWVWVPGSVAVVPGRPYVRPMYAPALVAFVGGGGFSVSIGLGGGIAGVAWFPLGPRDVWVPSYHASPAYVQNVNVSNSTVINRTQITTVYNTTTVTNVTNVTNITYMNQNAPGAVTAVSKEAFTTGKPVAAAAVKVTPQQIQHPQVVERTAAAPPRNLAPAAAVKASARPPAALANRPIVTKMKPSPQVVPIGHKDTIARSNLVKPAPPAPPAKKLPPPAPATRPAAAPAPGKPVPPAVKPATPPPSKAVTPPPSRPVTPPPSRPVTPPPSKAVTPPPSKAVTPPPSKAVTPPPSKAVTPPPSKAVTPPPSKAVTPPPSKAVTPPPSKAVTPPPSKAVTPPPSKAVTPPPSKAVTPPPSKPAKEKPKKTEEPEHPSK
jgi:hypothetical protein